MTATRPQAVQGSASIAAAAAIERLFAERIAVKDVTQLTGLDQATVRRLRQLGTDADAGGAEGADVVVA